MVLVRPAAVSEAALNGTLLNCASGAIPIEYAGRSAIHSALVARQVVVAKVAFLLKLLALCVESGHGQGVRRATARTRGTDLVARCD